MAIDFQAVQEFRDEPIVLPIVGRDGTVTRYSIEQLDGEQWTLLASVERANRTIRENLPTSDGDRAALQKLSNREYFELILGADNLTLMETNRVHSKLFNAAAATAAAFHLNGVEQARAVWTRNLAQLGNTDPTQTTPQTAPGGISTASDKSTRPPGSTKATTSRRARTKVAGSASRT